MLDTKSLSTNCVASLSPMPSISWNLHQYSKDLTTLAGQLVLPHFRNAPSERRLLHLGHSLGTTADFVGRGSSNGRPSECNRPNTSSGEALPITPIIFGMTSPRLTIFTKSPILMPNLCTSPGLWRVVFSTVTPRHHDRSDHGNRGHVTSSTSLPIDAHHNRCCLLWWKFPSKCPSGVVCSLAEHGPLPQLIHLNDKPVDLPRDILSVFGSLSRGLNQFVYHCIHIVRLDNGPSRWLDPKTSDPL